MSKLCNRPNCALAGKLRCSACQNQWYCSAECQKASWKDHKITCGKKLFSQNEFNEYLEDKHENAKSFDLKDSNAKNITYLKNAILIAEYQFADQVPGECFRKLKNGITFKKDMLLFSLRELLTQYYINQNTATSFDIALEYAHETRARLEMRRSNPEEEDRESFFNNIYKVNTQIGDVYRKMMRHVESLKHFEEALDASRQCGHADNERIHLLQALSNVTSLHRLLKTGEAGKFAEEAYLFVSERHGLDHPHVQGAATYLIDSYLDAGNYVDAERFARINYECLLDPVNDIDREGELFAIGKVQVAKIWSLTPPDQRIGGPEAAEEAEKLAREGCDIFEKIGSIKGFDDHNSSCLANSQVILVRVMFKRGKTDGELEKVLLRALSFTKEMRTGVVPRLESSFRRYGFLKNLADYYFHTGSSVYDIVLLEKAKYAYEECVIIAIATFNADDEKVLLCRTKLRDIDRMLSVIAKY
jgi:tetratricopeptide (TPR) repeat protein